MTSSFSPVFKSGTSDIRLCLQYATECNFMWSIRLVQSRDRARQQHAGRGKMNPQLPVQVNSALLNRMQQYVLIKRLSKLLSSHGICAAPPQPHPPPSRSVTTLRLLLSKTRLSPKAHRASDQEPGWVGTLRMQSENSQLNGQIDGEERLASGPPRSQQHPLRGSWLFLCAARRPTTATVWPRPLQICSYGSYRSYVAFAYLWDRKDKLNVSTKHFFWMTGNITLKTA